MKRFACYSLSFCLISLFWIASIAAAQRQESAVLVIEGGTLIDGKGGDPVPDAVVIIRDNKIETVSRKGQVRYPAGAQVLQADGKFILPGLADSHAHYQWWMPELMLHYGVTTVYDIAGSGQWGLVQREAIARGKVPGPRLFTSLQSLVVAWPGRLMVGSEGPVTAEKAREAVKRNLAAKADLINVRRGLSQEVFQTAVAEAHKAGLPVVAQSIGPVVYGEEAVLAGADILEHAAGIGISIAKDPSKWRPVGEDELTSLSTAPWADMDEKKAEAMIRLLVERKVSLETDFIAEGRGLQVRAKDFEWESRLLYDNPLLAYVPEDRRGKELMVFHELDDLDPAAREQRVKGLRNFEEFIARYVRAGGTVLVGDDTSSWAIPGLGVHHEMQLLVEEVGLTPMQVIQAATRDPARAYRVIDRIGTVEAGKFADLVIVSADPLQNIRNLDKIDYVVKDGKVVDRTFHSWFRNPLRNSYWGGTVESREWVAALKQTTAYGVRQIAGLTDRTHGFGQPCPGIETISPVVVTEGDPTVTLTIRGVNFTNRSMVLLDNQPIPARLVSETELEATIDAKLILRPETFIITVKNPGVLVQPQWGGTSNRAYLLVNFRY